MGEKVKKRVNNIINSLKNFKFDRVKIDDKIRYFIGNFWPAILIFLFILVFIGIKLRINRNFHTTEITKIIENSNYAGNAVIINKKYFLTTYDTVNSICKNSYDNQITYFYIITNDGDYYRAKMYAQDNQNNLAILQIDDDIKNKALANNYVVLPAMYNTLLNSNVFVSKTKNTLKSHFYEKSKISGLSNVGFYTKKNNFRSNIGESVLNNRLEFVGLTTGNSKSSKYKFFLNEVDIVNQNKIEAFLRRNKINYYKNVTNLDLIKYPNYIRNMNVKVVCITKTARVPLVMKVRR